MIPKMRGLLKPTSKDEVDFAEATKDCSKNFMWWVDNQPAGNRAFIPDDTDREVCFSALKMYFCAAEEANIYLLSIVRCLEARERTCTTRFFV